MNMFLHGFDNATIRWGDTIRNPKLKEGDALMKFDTVVPHGVLFRGASEGKIRQKTIEENILEAVVLFIDSSKHYESAKNQNKLRVSDIEHIVDTYRRFNEGKLSAGIVEDKFSFVATFSEIEENKFNLNIPRYIDTFEEEEVDIATVQIEIDKLEGELKTVQSEMNKYLNELGAIEK